MKTLFRRSMLGTAVAALAAFATAAGAADFEWKFFTSLGMTDPGTQMHRQFAEDLGKATNGRLRIQVFTAGELPYKGPDVLRVISSKQVEMGHMAIGFIAGDLPEIGAFSMPFECSNVDAFFDKSVPAVAPLIDKAMLDKFNVKPLVHWMNGYQQIFLKRPIAGTDELKGKKVRAWNREQIEVMKAMGGTGVSITSTEVMPALDRGIVDGAFTSFTTANAWKMNEVAKFGYVVNISLSHELVAINRQALESLPADMQKVVLQKAGEWGAKYRSTIVASEKQARDTLTAQGIQFRELSAAELKHLKDATSNISKEWTAKNGPVAADMLARIRKTCI